MSEPLKQVAALPVVETEQGPLVLLITTRGRGRWTIPKGWPKLGMTDRAMAAKEAAAELTSYNQEVARLSCISPPALSRLNASESCDADNERTVPCVGVASCKGHVKRIDFFLNATEQFFSETLSAEVWQCH